MRGERLCTWQPQYGCLAGNSILETGPIAVESQASQLGQHLNEGGEWPFPGQLAPQPGPSLCGTHLRDCPLGPKVTGSEGGNRVEGDGMELHKPWVIGLQWGKGDISLGPKF